LLNVKIVQQLLKKAKNSVTNVEQRLKNKYYFLL